MQNKNIDRHKNLSVQDMQQKINYQLYIILFLSGLIIVFLRSGYNIIVPSVYTEDGYWTGLIIQNGLIDTLLHARPDYFVSGNILGLYIAYILNKIMFGYDISNLPVYIALVQYIFYSLTALLPVIVFRRYVNKLILILMWLSVLLIPLLGQGFEIFGKISNIGYLFYLIAFCLLFYRIDNRNILLKKQVVLIDIMLFICCTTNPVCFILILLGFFIDIFLQRDSILNKEKISIRSMFLNFMKQFSNKSLIILAVSCIMIVIFHILFQSNSIRNTDMSGIPWNGLILKLTLFPLIYPFFNKLNNFTAIILILVTFIYFVYTFMVCNKKEKFMMFILLGGFLVYTITFIYGRTDQTKYYTYTGIGPDRYVYAIEIQFMILLLYSVHIHLYSRHVIRKFISIFIIVFYIVVNLYNYKTIFPFSNPETDIVHSITFKQRIDETYASTFVKNDDDIVRIKIDPPNLNFYMDVPYKYIKYSRFGGNIQETIYLSNFTDSNWNNGIAKFDNRLLLFDKKYYNILMNSEVLSTIFNNKKYSAKILNIENKGDFIHIYVDTDMTSIFAYPASIHYKIKDELQSLFLYDLIDSYWNRGVNVKQKNILLFSNNSFNIISSISEIQTIKNNKEYTAKILDIQKHGDYIHVITDMADASVFAYPAKIQYTLK